MFDKINTNQTAAFRPVFADFESVTAFEQLIANSNAGRSDLPQFRQTLSARSNYLWHAVMELANTEH